VIPLAAINQLAAVYRGRGRNEAYLEFAQEHFLDWLRLEGLFKDDAVVFKGGTAIRKFVLGNEGRFSTDLDFAVEDPIYADHILERLDQRVTHEGVTFVLDKYDAAARKGSWHAETAEHGASLPASLDFSPRPLLLPATPSRARADPRHRTPVPRVRTRQSAGRRSPGDRGREAVAVPADDARSRRL
jgi:predicted nucleotidyltransferase component of viral defense system